MKYKNERIEKAQNENEMWNVVNEVINPNKDNTWKMKIDEIITNDEEVIANAFNIFFIDKVKEP